MNTKYTSGPWALADENNQCCSVLFGNEYNLTCSLDRQDGNTGAFVIERSEMIANARLIASAPDLLEALQYSIKQVPELASVPGVAAAIAKATGEQK